MSALPTSRRNFLTKVAAALGGASVISTTAAAAPPATAPLALPAPASATLDALASQLRDLLAERERVSVEIAEAARRFWDLAPRRPRDLYARPETMADRSYVCLECNASENLWDRGPHSTERLVYARELMERDVGNHSPGSPRGRWLLKRLKLAQRFEAESAMALERSGHTRSSERAARVERDIGAVCRAIFAFPVRDFRDAQAHALAIWALLESGHDGEWARWAPTEKLLSALVNLASG